MTCVSPSTCACWCMCVRITCIVVAQSRPIRSELPADQSGRSHTHIHTQNTRWSSRVCERILLLLQHGCVRVRTNTLTQTHTEIESETGKCAAISADPRLPPRPPATSRRSPTRIRQTKATQFLVAHLHRQRWLGWANNATRVHSAEPIKQMRGLPKPKRYPGHARFVHTRRRRRGHWCMRP